MRRIISLALALSLVAVGASGLVYLMLFAAGWKGWMVMASGLIFTAGAIWLYDDFSGRAPNQRS